MRDKSKLFPQFLFRSYVSHTYLFPRTTTTATGRTRASTRLTPTEFAKPPDEAMIILELLSLHLSVDGLVKAIACDQRTIAKRLKDIGRHRGKAAMNVRRG